MNLLHALGFFVLGLAMAMLPELAPVLAPADAEFGDVAALWLEFMGVVMFLIGSGYTAKCIAAELPKLAPEQKSSAAASAKAPVGGHSTFTSTANRAGI